jgi:cephalosporin hydroxylase
VTQDPALDSDHAKDHVLAELRAYAPLVGQGMYLIAEDTAAARVVPPVPSEGPREAVAAFLAQNRDFAVDERCEKFLMTWQPGGYLRRVNAHDSNSTRGGDADE